MKEDLISVIVPVYNAESYVEKAISSIIMQTYENYELIITDDFSKDNSFSIINKYAGNKIKIIKHDKNLGAGAARNTGLKHAHGKYVAFIDADDAMSKDALKIAYEFIKRYNCDFVQFGYNANDSKGVYIKHMNSFEHLDNNIAVCENYANSKITWGIWDKIYNREFLEKNCISFDDKNEHEDQPYVFDCVINAASMVFVPRILYDYFHHSKSRSTCTINEEYLNTYFKNLKMYLDKCAKYPLELQAKVLKRYMFWLFDILKGKNFGSKIILN